MARREDRREDRLERARREQRDSAKRIRRNWIICGVSLALAVLAYVFGNQLTGFIPGA